MVEMDSGLRVVSREFSEELRVCLVVEASQAGAIVVGNEGVEVGVAFGMVDKAAVVGGAVLRHAVEMFAEASVEALDHAVIRHDDFGALVYRFLEETAFGEPIWDTGRREHKSGQAAPWIERPNG